MSTQVAVQPAGRICTTIRLRHTKQNRGGSRSRASVAIEVGSRSFWLAAAATVGAVGLNSVDDLLLSHRPSWRTGAPSDPPGIRFGGVAVLIARELIAPIGWRHG